MDSIDLSSTDTVTKWLQQNIPNFSSLTSSTARTIAELVKSGQMKTEGMTVELNDNDSMSVLFDGRDWHGRRSFYDSWYNMQIDKQIIY